MRNLIYVVKVDSLVKKNWLQFSQVFFVSILFSAVIEYLSEIFTLFALWLFKFKPMQLWWCANGRFRNILWQFLVLPTGHYHRGNISPYDTDYEKLITTSYMWCIAKLFIFIGSEIELKIMTINLHIVKGPIAS